jgi:hypothetical protein
MSLPSYVGIWKGRDFLNTQDYTQEEINMILDAADDLRNKFRSRGSNTLSAWKNGIPDVL